MENYRIVVNFLGDEKVLYVRSERTGDDLLNDLQRLQTFSCVRVYSTEYAHTISEEELWNTSIVFNVRTSERTHTISSNLEWVATIPAELADRLEMKETNRHYGHIRIRHIAGFSVDMDYFMNLLSRYGVQLKLSDDGEYFWANDVYELKGRDVFCRRCVHEYRALNYTVTIKLNEKENSHIVGSCSIDAGRSV